MKHWKIILAALVIYTAGVVTGALTVNLSVRHQRHAHPPGFRPPPMSDLMGRMERRLDLSPKQRLQIETILRASQQRMRELMGGLRPRISGEFDAMRKRITSELKADQQKDFERLFRHYGPRGGRPERGPRSGREFRGGGPRWRGPGNPRWSRPRPGGRRPETPIENDERGPGTRPPENAVPPPAPQAPAPSKEPKPAPQAGQDPP